jgi:hypothetical protein
MLKAEHRDRQWLGIELLNLASLVGFGLALTQRWGAVGMAAANFLLLGNLWMALEVRRVFGSRFAALLGELALTLVVPLPAFALAAWFLPPGSWARFAGSIGAAAFGAGLLWWRYGADFRTFFGRRGEAA